MPINPSTTNLSLENGGETRPGVKFWLGLALLYAIIAAALFGWTLWKAYFFSDDFTWLWHGAKINLNLYNVLTFRMSSFYSPVLNLFYTVMYQIFGFAAPAYFAFGILVHLANSLLAALIAWQLSRSRLVAAVTGLLFVWAGAAFEPLVWVGANMHSIATLFIFLGIACYLAYLNGGKKIYLLFSFLAALLAIGSKEIAAIFPVLLIAILFIFWKNYKNKIFSKAHLIYWTTLIILFLLYGWQQYLWQKQSFTVSSGALAFSWHTFARLPIVIADLFIPLGEITPLLHHLAVGWLILACSGFLVAIAFTYRKLSLVRFGFIWIVITIAPTIMLATVNWWDPLASRYTYLPRFGMIIILAAILHYHVSQKKSRLRGSAMAAIIIILTGWQTVYLFQVVNRDYPYVYQTGRSLVAAMKEVEKLAPIKLFIRWDYPFTGNNAHLYGAAITIGRMKDDGIIFPPADEKIQLQPGEVLMYWDGDAREYKIKKY
ncbi:MAG: hypothetical protein PHE24_03670 [Patescibacteria group bacterium]|nr:hypothetical protein [Patescibacteria group bacterium]